MPPGFPFVGEPEAGSEMSRLNALKYYEICYQINFDIVI